MTRLKRPLAGVIAMVGALGGTVTSAAAAVCCIGPLALTVLGVNGMILAAGLKPYRFYLLGVSGLMIGLAFALSARPVDAGAHCPTRRVKVTRGILRLAAAAWIVSFALQFLSGRIIL